MADNLLVRRFKNTGTTPGTVDFWVYDLDYSHNSPVTVYVDVLEKVTTDSVLATYKKESRGVRLKKPQPEPVSNKVVGKTKQSKVSKPVKKVEKHKKKQKKTTKLVNKKPKPTVKKKNMPIKSTKKNLNKVFNEFFGD